MESIFLDLSRANVLEDQISKYSKEIDESESRLSAMKLPVVINEAEQNRIIAAAEKIRSESDVLIVLGVGAIYSGARAGLELLKPYWQNNPDVPEIIFAGWNACGEFYDDLLKKLKGRAFSILMMAKGLIAPETEVIFSYLKQEMYRKYGRDRAADRIYAVRGGKTGDLGLEAEREGYHTFTFPEEISTSYAILSAAGLLPLAVVGVNIDEIIHGATNHKLTYEKYMNQKKNNNSKLTTQMPEISKFAQEYAAVRHALAERGKKVEVIEYYENSMAVFVEWVKHLFAGSEGKCEKGVFPTSLSMSNDLLDMGQFLQQGEQFFFETIIDVSQPVSEIVCKNDEMPSLVKTMDQVNRAIMTGLIQAHSLVGLPMIRVKIPAITPYYYGQMVYFFIKVAAVSSWLNDVDPFEHEALDIFQEELHSLNFEW